MESVKKILEKYISDRIPKKVTNILFQMFNGIDAVLQQFEYTLNIHKRESNILTATKQSSLRHLAALNGFEPVLKKPSFGILVMKANPKLFQKYGYPLYLPAYSVFTNKQTNIDYYFNDNKVRKITNDHLFLNVIEGCIETIEYTNNDGNHISKIYLDKNDISSVVINGFTEVNSFMDNDGLFDNKQFIVKFSNKTNTPIVVYLKGLNYLETIQISFRITCGELGNIDYKTYFETNNILDSQGNEILLDEDDMEIINFSGFSFGSNGTTENAFRSAIGYNHGSKLLFDNTSYVNFLSGYSNILIQNVVTDSKHKSIHHLFLSKIYYLSDTDLINQYNKLIQTDNIFFDKKEKETLSEIISKNEYALSSSTINNSLITKYSIQLSFKTNEQMLYHYPIIENNIYKEFSIFLNNKHYIFNFDLFITEYSKVNNIEIEYTLFNSDIEQNILELRKQTTTNHIIRHTDKLPVLSGDFYVYDTDFNPIKLFSNINKIVKS